MNRRRTTISAGNLHGDSRHTFAAAHKCVVARAAYTLVEVLVVITIIGIASAVVVPSMLSRGSLNAQAALRMVMSDLIFAQNEAVARQSTREVIFDVELNKYRLVDNTGATLYASWRGGQVGVGNYITDFNSDSRFSGVRIENVSFNSLTKITFDALGGVANGGSLDIVSGGLRYRLTLAPLTGRVTVTTVNGG